MSLWEYKHITSGPHGFATPALLESYLNQLGKDEWEIICFQPYPNNPLGFSGVARRTTLRDWTLESAAAAAAKAEADKLRAEFAAKFQGATATSPAAASEAQPEKPATLVTEVAAPEDGLRKLRDTERDSDPDAQEEGEDWDNWEDSEDDLPTFFEAIKPHLRKNQRGPGQSVGITFLAKRWEQTEGDMINALKECGFTIPEREDDPPVHLEFEGELYWLNLNNRHELFLNTREKPRPVFRVAKAKPLDPADPAAGVLAEEAAAEAAEKAKREAERLAREAEQAARRAEHEARRAAAQAAREAAQAERAAAAAAAAANGSAVTAGPDGATPSTDSAGSPDGAVAATAPVADVPAGPLPQGDALLAAIRPQMRRNRRGPGYSGSTTYLARAFKQSEADLVSAFAALGLHVPENANEKPVKTAIGGYVYWLNKDGRGGIWINGDEIRGQKNAAPASSASAVAGGDSTTAVQPSSAEVPASAEVANGAVASADASTLVEPVTPPAESMAVSADAVPSASEAAAALAPETGGETVKPLVEAAPVASETSDSSDTAAEAGESDADAEAAGEEAGEPTAEGAPEAARPKRTRAPRKPAAKKKKPAEKDE